jgi:hypothetical protein
MLTRVQKTYPALKHGGYSSTTILPGEDPTAFEKPHRQLIAELSPKGMLEHDVVATIARLVWRKQNLATFRLAELARERREAIRSEHVAAALAEKQRPLRPFLGSGRELEAAEREAAVQPAEHQARKELGETYQLAEIGETATVDRLLRDLGVEERLDAMIDKCLKRLLFLRGLKSLSTASSSAPPQPIPKAATHPGPNESCVTGNHFRVRPDAITTSVEHNLAGGYRLARAFRAGQRGYFQVCAVGYYCLRGRCRNSGCGRV